MVLKVPTPSPAHLGSRLGFVTLPASYQIQSRKWLYRVSCLFSSAMPATSRTTGNGLGRSTGLSSSSTGSTLTPASRHCWTVWILQTLKIPKLFYAGQAELGGWLGDKPASQPRGFARATAPLLSALHSSYLESLLLSVITLRDAVSAKPNAVRSAAPLRIMLKPTFRRNFLCPVSVQWGTAGCTQTPAAAHCVAQGCI